MYLTIIFHLLCFASKSNQTSSMQKIISTTFEPAEFRELLTASVAEVLAPVIQHLQKTAEPEKGFLTRHETAKRLNLSLSTLHTRTVSGEIPSHRIGKRILYKPDEVEQCAQKRVFKVLPKEGRMQ
jgi:excisionase family DNA binding protein